MNVFYLSQHPRIAAEYHCDKHVVKMVLESTQLACGIHHIIGTKNIPDNFMRLVYKNHPWAKWARASIYNYRWLVEHAFWLSEEFTYRYESRHAKHPTIIWCMENEPDLPSCGITDHPLCMPEQFFRSTATSSYKAYYRAKRSQMKMRWTKRGEPYWL